MYTENLVNLFGGSNETPAKKNNTNMIIIIAVIVGCLLVFCAFFMMNNQKKQKQTNTTEKTAEKTAEKTTEKTAEKTAEKIDHCAKYNDNSEDYSFECMEQIWKNTGCTTNFKDTMKFKMDESISKGVKNPPLKQLKQAYNMMVNIADEGKEMCYGKDKSKWPTSKCDEYTQESTNISDDCITEIYKSACPAFNIKNVSSKEQTEIKKSPLGFLKFGGLITSTQGDEKNRTLCYGPDKSKWPEVCSHFQDDSQMVSKECIEDIWKKTGCTKSVPTEYNTLGKMKGSKAILKLV